MSMIQFKEANCKSCYKCIRNCELKAIRFKDEQARIVDDDCILCGKCTLVCPQNAKQIFSDLDEVRSLINSGTKVFVSLAPSYISAFPGYSFAQISGALKQLGFTGVEETAIGATEVSKEYSRLLTKKEMKNLITTCCPAVCMLVEKYYPALIPYLAPVVSPATAHAKMMKNLYGNRIKVVFVGPCIAKKHEAQQGGIIHSVLLFDEIKAWMDEADIVLESPDREPTEMHTTVSRLYPMPGGIIRTIPHNNRQGYKTLAVDGLDRCITTLDSIQKYNVEGYFVEMSSCAGSCIDGPGMRRDPAPFLVGKTMITAAAAKKTATPKPITENSRPDLFANYNHTRVRSRLPDESEIAKIYHQIGKYTDDSLLNCGACGYNTCRDKAIAVYQGKADLHMCLPYLREKAESMSNLIFDNTPNGCIIIDKNLEIEAYNKAAETIFGIDANEMIRMPIRFLINAPAFDQLGGAQEKTLIYSIFQDEERELTLDLIIASAERSNDFIIIARDITAENKDREKLEEMRRETIDITQRVIDKQMRVAQEIASLLGETTGETKAALTNLKKSMMAGDNL